MNKYILELNDEQIKNMMWALNLYSRLKCGQIDNLRELTDSRPTDDTLAELQKQMFPTLSGLNSSWGIAGKNAPEDAKVCYDIYKKIHFIWNPVGVYANKPYAQSKQGLPIFYKQGGIAG